MTFLQLSYIIAVAEERNISRAAEKLHVSQPSISRLISNIEDEYCVKLFKRMGHNIELTSAGRMFVDEAQKILAQNKSLDAMMRDIGKGQPSRLSFGCSTNHIAYLIPRFLKKITALYPSLEVSVLDDNSNALFKEASQGKIDLIYSHIHPSSEISSDFECVPLAKERMLLVVPEDHWLSSCAQKTSNWYERPAISIRDFANEPFIQLKKGHTVRILTDKIFDSENIRPTVKLESSNNSVAHNLVAAGLGISILPESEVRFNLTSKPCLFFPIDNSNCSRQIYISYLKSVYTSKFIATCVDAVQEITVDIFTQNRLIL